MFPQSSIFVLRASFSLFLLRLGIVSTVKHFCCVFHFITTYTIQVNQIISDVFRNEDNSTGSISEIQNTYHCGTHVLTSGICSRFLIVFFSFSFELFIVNVVVSFTILLHRNWTVFIWHIVI